jgi:hypothetical protein
MTSGSRYSSWPAILTQWGIVLFFVALIVGSVAVYRLKSNHEDEARKKHQAGIVATIENLTNQLNVLATRQDYVGMLELCKKSNEMPNWPIIAPETGLNCREGTSWLLRRRQGPPELQIWYYENRMAVKGTEVRVVVSPHLEVDPIKNPNGG